MSPREFSNHLRHACRTEAGLTLASCCLPPAWARSVACPNTSLTSAVMASRSRLAEPTHLSGLRGCFDIGAIMPIRTYGCRCEERGAVRRLTVAALKTLVASWVRPDFTGEEGVPRCVGPGCCAARRAAVKGPVSRPFGRPSLTRACRHLPCSLLRRVAPDCGAARLAGALANAAIKAALSSRRGTAEVGLAERQRAGMAHHLRTSNLRQSRSNWRIDRSGLQGLAPARVAPTFYYRPAVALARAATSAQACISSSNGSAFPTMSWSASMFA